MVINGAKDKISIPIEEIDIDQNMDAVKKYNIRGVPVLILADDDGTEIDRMTGLADEKKLLEFIGD
jgi:thioredoxin-like negative regulator of GroEL